MRLVCFFGLHYPPKLKVRMISIKNIILTHRGLKFYLKYFFISSSRVRSLPSWSSANEFNHPSKNFQVLDIASRSFAHHSSDRIWSGVASGVLINSA